MLNRLVHLAQDGYNNVIVVDEYNNRIVLLSPKLAHLGYIDRQITEYTYMTNPWGLHLDRVNKRLYVGEHTDTRNVYVLKVSATSI